MSDDSIKRFTRAVVSGYTKAKADDQQQQAAKAQQQSASLSTDNVFAAATAVYVNLFEEVHAQIQAAGGMVVPVTTDARDLVAHDPRTGLNWDGRTLATLPFETAKGRRSFVLLRVDVPPNAVSDSPSPLVVLCWSKPQKTFTAIGTASTPGAVVADNALAKRNLDQTMNEIELDIK